MRSTTFADALRWSLFAALGVPLSAVTWVACGGVTAGEGDGNHQGAGGSTAGSGGDGTTPSGGTSSGSGGSDGGLGGATCTDPVPHAAGHDTGFVRCAEGYLHRVEKKACPSTVPRTDTLETVSEELDECHSDSDCSGDYAHCAVSSGGGFQPPFLQCRTGCVADSDCATGSICLCGDPVGQCVPTSGCTVDSECAGDSLCLGQLVPGVCGEGSYEFGCEQPDDECRTNADCTGGQMCNGDRTCEVVPVCGRPFLVESVERRAEATRRGDWLLPVDAPELGALTTHEREALARHWQSVALMEHASIAAFARFSLQLLALGAPADLVERTNRALADETRHSRVAFALASHYAGRSIGPGPLELAGAFEGQDAGEILRTTILEGCVGETLAALEAAEGAALAREGRLAEVLDAIARDEARHAELAWCFVQWLLGERPELAEVVRETFAAVVAGRVVGGSAEGPTEEVDGEADLSAFGVLTSAASRRLRQEALASVIAPCAAALLTGQAATVREGAGSTVFAPTDSVLASFSA